MKKILRIISLIILCTVIISIPDALALRTLSETKQKELKFMARVLNAASGGEDYHKNDGLRFCAKERELFCYTVFYYADMAESKAEYYLGKNALVFKIIDSEYASEHAITRGEVRKVIRSFFGPGYNSKEKEIMSDYPLVNNRYRIEHTDGMLARTEIIDYTIDKRGNVEISFEVIGNDTGYVESDYPVGTLKMWLKPYKESLFGYYVTNFEYETKLVNE